jgi:hypothetical protein
LNYTFKIDGTKTPVGTSQTVQTNTIDAYGTWDSQSGLNENYTKTDGNGVTYRFLGWNTDKNATEPLEKLSITNKDRQTSVTEYDNTTLYAVWEPVLSVDITLNRTLGNLSSTTTTSLTDVTNSSSNKTLTTVIKPGEQGYYTISTPNDNVSISVTFDSQMTKMYDDSTARWYDTLNPASNITKDGDSNPVGIKTPTQSLNRVLKTISNESITRKFYVPQYLGTSSSYTENQGVYVYDVTYTITGAKSYFYGGTAETVTVTGKIYLNSSSFTSSSTGNTNGSISYPDNNSVLSEFKTQIK